MNAHTKPAPDTATQPIATARLGVADAKHAATTMKRVAGGKRAIPILRTALIHIKAGEITFETTDLDRTAVMEFEAETTGRAAFTIPVQTLNAVANAAIGHVEISLSPAAPDALNPANVVTLKSDGLTVHSADLYPVEDFPRFKVPAKETPHTLTASHDDIARAFSLGRHCISTQETRYYLNGAHITQKPDGDTMRVVTTDGHRMAVIDTAIPMNGPSIIIPSETVDILTHHLRTGANSTVTVRYYETRIVIELEGVTLFSKLIDGTYPDYQRVIPTGDATTTFDLTQTTIKRFASIARAISGHYHRGCTLDPIKGEIRTKGATFDGASAPISGTGETIVTVHGPYLNDQAKATPTFKVHAMHKSDPLRIYCDDPDALFILMPMREERP